MRAVACSWSAVDIRPQMSCSILLASLKRTRTCKLPGDRKSTRLHSSHTDIYTLPLPDALPIYGSRRVLVVGGGHSAANVLLDLARLAETDADLQITWAVRAPNLARVFGGGPADKLPARGKLGDELRHLVDSGRLKLALSFGVEQIDRRGDGLSVREGGADPRVLGPVDRIVVCPGQRPDLSD